MSRTHGAAPPPPDPAAGGERRQRERRQGDRRRGERRQVDTAPATESWFGALGALDEQASALEAPSRLAEPDGPADAPDLLAREARRLAASDETAFERVFRAYSAARAALGVALVLAPWLASLFGARADLVLMVIGLAYAAQAVAIWLLGVRTSGATLDQRRRGQWLATIGVDLLAFSALHLLEPRSNLNFAALLVLPVLMSGVMSIRMAALAVTSVAALVLLAGVWRQPEGAWDNPALLAQAGLAGAGLFVIALLAGELAQRLAREERAARGSMAVARQQAQLNRLVLEEMAEGVLVIDRKLRLRAANPAAMAMMGLSPRRAPLPQPLDADPGWSALRSAVEEAYARGGWPESARELPLGRSGEEPVRVTLRARFTLRRTLGDDSAPPEDVCVLFAEDLRSVQARQRQDKLAAMGRMSAGIAHEFRNPLAAIAQATALLREDALSQAQARLAAIVSDNSERLRRIVDDVIDAASAEPAQPPVVDLAAAVRTVVEEWSRSVSPMPDQRLQLSVPDAPMPVHFDPEHLRRTLVNLLDNAARHAGLEPGAIAVALRAAGPRHAHLDVASDGAPIPLDVERHLFEPFFSTRSRGSGLGLYICRELCVRNGASIDYLRPGTASRHRNLFRIRASLAGGKPEAGAASAAAATERRTMRP